MNSIVKLFENHRLSIIPRHLIRYSPDKVFIDKEENPRSAAINYSSLFWLGGEFSDALFTQVTSNIGPHTTYFLSDQWLAELKEMDLQGELALSTIERNEFSSEEINLEHLEELLFLLPKDLTIKKIDRSIAEDLFSTDIFESKGHIHPYGNINNFLNEGLGFVIVKGYDYLAIASSVATTTFPRHEIEVQVDVSHAHRKQGLAKIVSAALIKECFRLGVNPHWDAANLESTKVALALGYKITEPYFAYKIKLSSK